MNKYKFNIISNFFNKKAQYFCLAQIFVSLIYANNQPPIIPTCASTQLISDTINAIEFTTLTTDPENEKVSYQFDWGDGLISDWLQLTNSGYLFSTDHLYKITGTHYCMVRAKDDSGNVSDWSAPCTLSILPSLLKWQYESGSGIYSGVALGFANEIYLTCEDGTLHSLNPDGTLRWKFATLGSIYSAPAIGTDAIYITSTEGRIYAIDFSGNELWKFKMDLSSYSTPAIGKNGAIYFGCDDGNIYSLSKNGKLLWKYKTGDEIAGAPSISKNGTIYCASDAIYALDTKGKPNWIFRPSSEEDGYFFASPSINNDGIIYIGATDGALYAITEQGRIKFRALTPDEDEIRAGVAIDKKGVVYFGSQNYVLNKKELYGEVAPVFETDYYIYSTPAIDTLGNIYFVSDDGYFYCLRQDGKLLYKWLIAEDSKEIMYSPSPLIADDGTVYVGSWDGKLYVFSGFAPSVKSNWSLFRHDLQNTGRIE